MQMQTNIEPHHRTLILGAGNFGTCLAHHLGRIGHDVLIWSRTESVVNHINQHHSNPAYLSSFSLPNSVKAISKLDANIFKSVDVIVSAIPTQNLRSVFETLRPWIENRHLIVNTAKGIEVKTSYLPSEIMTEVLGSELGGKVVVLAGPNFAVEIAEGQPTAAAMGCLDFDRARQAQGLFHSPYFRIYTNRDPRGLEVAGALKNIIALGAGVCSGLGFKSNSLAALITRGLGEMTRIGIALGAETTTFIGLGGVGDLFLTCNSPKSRNFTVGYRLGQGETLDSITATLGSVAEGVATAKAANELCKKLNVRTPIITAVYGVLYEDRQLAEVITALLTGDAKDELS